jgi:high-affinity nickel-transport protein
MVEIWSLVAISIPTMIFLGMRHALDVDHITAIDSLVRLHNAVKKSRWVGTGFSVGHMLSVLAEMIFIIYIIGSITSVNNFAFWGGVLGAIALGTIGAINIYSMKKWGRSGSAILSSKILNRTGVLGPVGSALVTGVVFGLGFDTATQISAIALSAVASATTGIQTALILSGFFAAGMISVDTMDSVILRSAFSKILHGKGFRYMSYALSGVALTIASVIAYETLTNSEILPKIAGPVLAVIIVSASFGYAFVTRKKSQETSPTN